MAGPVMVKRVVFTGGSGVAGQHVIRRLVDYGYDVLNIDLNPLDDKRIHTLSADLTQSGQVFNAFSSHFRITQPFPGTVSTPDAIVHFAGIPRNLLVTDDELFRINTVSTYNVIEAACKLGIKKIVLASSVCAYGVTFANGHIDFPSFPVEESLDVDPMDTYAISKLCMERVARGFARRFGIDIYILRLGAVILPDEHEEVFRGYVERPMEWKGHGWSYTDVRDLGLMCKLAIEKGGLGFQIFNATNDEITNNTPTERFLNQACPNVPFTRAMGPREAPLTNRKMKEMLGFEEEHNWRDYYGKNR